MLRDLTQQHLNLIWAISLFTPQAQLLDECKLTVPQGYSKLVPPARMDGAGNVIPATVDVNVDLIQVLSSMHFLVMLQPKSKILLNSR